MQKNGWFATIPQNGDIEMELLAPSNACGMTQAKMHRLDTLDSNPLYFPEFAITSRSWKTVHLWANSGEGKRA